MSLSTKIVTVITAVLLCHSAAARAQSVEEETVVRDETLLSLAACDAGGAPALVLATDDGLVVTSGRIVDELTADVEVVGVEVAAPAGRQVRVVAAPPGGLAVSTAWSADRVAFELPLRDGEAEVELRVEVRERQGAPTIAVHGYIRVKKLNSGG
jgi:hypothetical protein